MAAAVLAGGCAGPPLDEQEGALAAWRAARIYLPAGASRIAPNVIGGRRDAPAIAAVLAAIPPGRGIPTVVYLHGCTGFGRSGDDNARMLAEAGYAVIAPDSFARPGRPTTCDPKRHRGIANRRVTGAVYAMRQMEIKISLARLAEFPWADRENLFLFGHSQGCSAAAAYPGTGFKARVLSGCRCRRGVRLPAGEPVLSVYSAGDPWYRSGNRPTCARQAGGEHIQSLELPGAEHVVARVPRGRRAMIDFLRRHTRAR